MADEQDGYVPREFNDANIRVAREFKAQRDALVKAIADIKAATLNGGICDDVAWFGPGETLHDFCERTLVAVSNARESNG